MQASVLPSVEVLVKALTVISSTVLATGPSVFTRVMFCAHHPCLVGSAKRDAVWKVSFLSSFFLFSNLTK